MRWTEEIISDFHDTDINGNIRPAALIKYFQSACDHQMNAQHPSSEELLAEGKAFFLSRIAVRFNERVKKEQKLKVSTFAVESRGYSFQRCGSIDRDDKNIMSLYSIWALINVEDRKPVRVNDVKLGYGMDDPIDPGVPIRFTLPEGEMLQKVGTRQVYYSDADFNGHMNNVRYPDIFLDFCNEIKNSFVEEMSIVFENEAKLGTEFDIYRTVCDNGVLYFKTVLPDGKTGATARIKIREN